MNYELAEGIWSCEQDDGPRIVREVVIAGDEAVLVVDTGLPGVGRDEWSRSWSAWASAS